MIFWKLNKKHKKWYLINQLMIIVLLVVAMLMAWKQTGAKLPTNTEKLSASLGFFLVSGFFMLAVLNRMSALFKIKSIGFVFMFIFFKSLALIIEPVTIAIGWFLIPLLIDDIIFKPIWNNIWYNQYDMVVKLHGKD